MASGRSSKERFADEMSHIKQVTNVQFNIDKGFVKNMQVRRAASPA